MPVKTARRSRKDKSILPYQSNQEFLQDALVRLALLSQRAVLLFRQQHEKNKEISHWQAITDEEIDRILFHTAEKLSETNQKILLMLEQQLTQHTKKMQERLQKNHEEQKFIPIMLLERLFNLSLFEIDILIICLAPSIDERYSSIYAYLQDHIHKTYPSMTLIFLLLAPTFSERMAMRAALHKDMPLLYWQMLQGVDDEFNRIEEGTAQAIKIPSDVSQFLLGASVALDINISPLPSFEKKWDQWIIPEHLKIQLQQMLQFLKEQPHAQEKSYLLYFYGEDSTVLNKLASCFFAHLGLNGYSVDAKILIQYLHIYGMEKTCRYITLLLRQNLLNHSAILIIRHADLLFAEDDHVGWLRQFLFHKMASVFRFISLIGNEIENNQTRFAKMLPHDLQFYPFYLPKPDYSLRLLLWQKILKEREISLPKTALEILANTFHFFESQITAIVDTAMRDAFYHPPAITVEKLLYYSKQQNKGKLAELSQLQVARCHLEDLVLPEKPRAQLEAICTFKKYHQQVYHQWNFNDKMNSREGIVALFHGVSGTGKTMAASIIAKTLNLELYRVDLALMVSKYIGETEKNLKEIFEAAKTLDVILFFDEADTLFSKRTNINDSHDRYANIETGYLLQRIEEYPGIVILATNLLQNIDEAFLRRFHFIIDFPFPDVAQRKKLWQKAFPKETPLENMDYDFLAEKIKLAGGNIRNIALHAAFLAASYHKPITMTLLLSAARDEYFKLGKLFIEKEFKPYL